MREMEDIKKNYMEPLELKNISGMINSLYRVNSRLETEEKTISELKYIAVENIHTEGKMGKRKMKGASVTCATVSRGFYQTSKEEIIPIVHRLSNIEKEMFFNSDKVSITLILKP